MSAIDWSYIIFMVTFLIKIVAMFELHMKGDKD